MAAVENGIHCETKEKLLQQQEAVEVRAGDGIVTGRESPKALLGDYVMSIILVFSFNFISSVQGKA